jgi:hypothetical protein
MNISKWVGLLVAVVLPLNFTTAQESVAPTAGPALKISGAAPVPVNISPATAEVIRLAESGVGDDVVLAYIQNSQAMFNLGADGVLYLRDVGLSSVVITAMLTHDAALMTQNPPNRNEVPPAPIQEPPPLPPTEEQVPMDYSSPPDYSTAPPAEVNYFYNGLAPYGTWVALNGVGWCWQPRVVLVNHGWRPYCDSGHWVNSDCGWYWQSDYSWGWAPFHYGRWQMHNRCGWVWVPDTVWAPAWVIWRTSGDYCGWAPVPPHAVFDLNFGWTFNGAHVGLGFDFGLKSDCFTFVANHDFTHHDLERRHLAATEVKQVYSQTTVINSFAVNNRMIVNRGIPVDRISAATHSEVRKVAIRDVPAVAGQPPPTRGVENGTPVVYRPLLHRPATAINVAAQKIDDRHPVIQHPTITPVRNPTMRSFTAPRSPIGSSHIVPRNELERRSSGAMPSVPRTYLQTPQASPGIPGQPPQNLNPPPHADARSVPVLRTSPQPSTFGTVDSARQVPRAYSPKGYERAMESQPMVRPESPPTPVNTSAISAHSVAAPPIKSDK